MSKFPLSCCDCMTWHADTSLPGDVLRPKIHDSVLDQTGSVRPRPFHFEWIKGRQSDASSEQMLICNWVLAEALQGQCPRQDNKNKTSGQVLPALRREAFGNSGMHGCILLQLSRPLSPPFRTTPSTRDGA